MEERVKRILERRAETYAQAAEQVVLNTVGTAVLELLARGRECDRTSLLAWLDETISDHQTPDVKRQMYEAARKKLLAASPWPSSG